jgi:hypothetical protein
VPKSEIKVAHNEEAAAAMLDDGFELQFVIPVPPTEAEAEADYRPYDFIMVKARS